MIIQTIDEYLVQRPRKERKTHCFHPSSLHLSAGKLYEHYLGLDKQKQHDSKILRIFDNGHAVHDRIQKYLEEIGILVEKEFPIRRRI